MKPLKPDETARCVMFVIDVADRPGPVDEQRTGLQDLLAGYASFKKWAFVLHDRDDEPPHWQGVVQTDKNYDGEVFANRLGIESVRKLAGGQKALIAGLRYLTHEDQDAKAQYARSAVVATPGWAWESDLDAATVKDSMQGGAGRKKIIASIQDGKLSARGAIRRGAGNERAVRIARAKHLRELESADLPAVRVNFYLEGRTHPSMERLAHALARTLASDRRFYRFEGHDFDEYDGEDVVLMGSSLGAWVRERFEDFIERGDLGDAADLFAILSATPVPHSVPSRYGKTQLVHRHTVIVGDESFAVFQKRLERYYARAVEDARAQSYMSLPVVVPVDAESFGVQVNSRFLLGRGELDQYIGSERYRLGLAEALASSRHVPEEQRERLVRELETQQTRPICDAGGDVALAMQPGGELTAEGVLAMHAGLGTAIPGSYATAGDPYQG